MPVANGYSNCGISFINMLPPAPEARKVSILNSDFSSSTSSTSSTSGKIATVTVEVCILPCDSVSELFELYEHHFQISYACRHYSI